MLTIDQITEIFFAADKCQAGLSRHRSMHGFIINVFAATGACHFLAKKPSIASQFETYQSSTLQLSL